MAAKTLSEEARQLPAYEVAEELNEKLRSEPSVVLTAPPGAGKSTLLPLTIMEGVEGCEKILMLEPRRIAARSVAERLAANIGEEVGKTVGYSMRFERKTTAETRIEIMTEGTMTRRLIDDATLDGVSVVVFDEFHERNLQSDLALALVRYVQRELRPELRILIMSATIDAEKLCTELGGAPHIECQGRMYPVEIVNLEECTAQDVAVSVAHAVRESLKRDAGNILAFLPGEGEIKKTAEILGNLGDGVRLYPLYGMLPQSQQRQAIAPSRPGERKVVLATPIAETSITINGIGVVVDSGFCRRPVFNPMNGLSALQTERISMDMAMQRAGRAGRTAEGKCYRLYSKATESRMKDMRDPEIETQDLTQMALDLLVFGESDADSLPWLTKPPKSHLEDARELLKMLKATDQEGRLTEHGRRIAKIPCHPRMAQMIVSGETDREVALAADVAALIEEKDPMNQRADTADINERIYALRRQRKAGKTGGLYERIERSAEQYRKIAGVREDNETVDEYRVGAMIAGAYPERIASCQDHHTGRYQLSNGQIAMVDREDMLTRNDWIAVATLSSSGKTGHIFYASPLSPKDLKPMVSEYDNVSWDGRADAVVSVREFRIGRLSLGQRPIRDVSKERIDTIVAKAIVTEGTRLLDFSEAAEQMIRRVRCVREWHSEIDLPELSEEIVTERAAEWVPAFRDGATDIQGLKQIDMAEVVRSMMTWEQMQAVDRIAPSHVEVPTGSKIRIEYRTAELPPVLKVRLQEVFGMIDTPRVDGGRRPLLMELLSPGYKPVQTTQDLRSFWGGTYFEVKKELKRRYPKHSWPDEPLKAEPVRGVKRK